MNDLHGRVCDILRKSRLPNDNLSEKLRKALKELKKIQDVVILSAAMMMLLS